MPNELLIFPHKRIRARIIKSYMERHGLTRAVCFSCGHASDELRAAGIDTLAVAPNGDLEARRWFSQGDIRRAFSGYFDATSGHLPAELMQEIGAAYREYLGALDGLVYVPCGSGETLVCLKMAYPRNNFVAVYNIDEATEYNAGAALNALVEALAERVVFYDKEGL